MAMNETRSQTDWRPTIIATRGVKRLKASIAKYGSTPARVAMLERFEKEAKEAKEELDRALRGEWAAQGNVNNSNDLN